MSFIITFTGKKLDFADPDPDAVDIVDIAVGLSRAARFAGQSLVKYTVAQHSVYCSHMVSVDHRLAALLHDATEAYLCDVPKPVKQQAPDYCAIERRLWHAITLRFGLAPELPAEVKDIDLRMLATEKIWLMPDHPDPWPALEGVRRLPIDITVAGAWNEEEAYKSFMHCFHKYSRERAAA